MDARPSRPARAFAVPGNENLHASTATAKQTIHQRHKSTGNLLNQPANGGMQVAAKRTVFGDRSNTSKYVFPRELSSMGKGTTSSMAAAASLATFAKAKENDVPIVAKDTFLRPAQRPSSKVASILPSANNGSYIMPLQGNESYLPAKQPHSKRASTIVYDDRRSLDLLTGESADYVASTSRDSSSHLESLKDRLALIVPESNLVQETAPVTRKPRHHQSQPALKASQQKWRYQGYQAVDTTQQPIPVLEDPIRPWDAPEAEDDQTEAPYLDAVEELPKEEYYFVQEPLELVNEPSITIPSLSETEVQPESELVDLPRQSARVVEFTESHLLPQLPHEEPVDISDYEDEEFYDDQGYTTAHSYRSRGDNTTGGTIMFPPKLSKKGAAELEVARELVESKLTDEQIEEETWDISMVAEYGDEIFEYMRELETNLQPNAHYMEIQTEIQWSMRSVLMDWVIQVHGRFGLLPETLFLTVNYIDRFLSYKVVSLGKLQLVGATAIFVAAKYEEINCPSVQEIVYMVDGGYTVEEILKAERFMLSMLNFELGWPGPMSFLRRISKADDYDLETRTLAKYFLEVTIMDERFVATPPSYVAAGAHCLSRLMLGKGDWSLDHVHYSGYTYAQVKPLVGMMLDCCRIARKHHGAVFEKYSDKRYKRSASYVQTELAKGFQLPFAYQLPCTVPFELLDEQLLAQDPGFGSHALRMPIPIQG